jgi:hypothetical protein
MGNFGVLARDSALLRARPALPVLMVRRRSDARVEETMSKSPLGAGTMEAVTSLVKLGRPDRHAQAETRCREGLHASFLESRLDAARSRRSGGGSADGDALDLAV